MARIPGKLPDGTGWVDEQVKYQPRHRPAPEFGRVVRMATGREPAAFVLFAGDEAAKLCYLKDLERL